MPELETQLAVLKAEQEHLRDAVADLQRVVRDLEAWRWKIAGLCIGGSALGAKLGGLAGHLPAWLIPA